VVDTKQLGGKFKPVFRCKIKKETEEEEEENTPGGLSSWPAVFSYPKEPPITDHWPNVVRFVCHITLLGLKLIFNFT
jgi:hypothetical protein